MKFLAKSALTLTLLLSAPLMIASAPCTNPISVNYCTQNASQCRFNSEGPNNPSDGQLIITNITGGSNSTPRSYTVQTFQLNDGGTQTQIFDEDHHPLFFREGSCAVEILVTDNNNPSCTKFFGVFIDTNNSPITAIQFTTTGVSCPEGQDGTITIAGVTGGVPTYRIGLDNDTVGNYPFFDGITPITFSNLTPGRHFIHVCDDNGCGATFEAIICPCKQTDCRLIECKVKERPVKCHKKRKCRSLRNSQHADRTRRKN